MTHAGMEEMKAINGEMKEMMMHSIAAQIIVATDAFLVIATQATDSP
jgi:hypothetical protein